MSNQLDNFFKNKLQERSFDYDESAWEDARLLIEADERGKKKRRYGFLLASFGLLMFVGISAYQLGKQSIESTISPTNFDNAKQSSDKVATKEIAHQDSDSSNQTTNTTEGSLSTPSEIAASQKSSSTTTNAIDSQAGIQNPTYTINKNQTTNTSRFNLGNASGVVNNTIPSYEPTTTHSNPNLVDKAAPKLFDSATSEISSKTELSQLPIGAIGFLGFSNTNTSDLVDLLPAAQKAIEGNPMTKLPSRKIFFGLRGGTAFIPTTFMDFEAGVELGYQLNRNWALALQPKYQYQSLSSNSLEESLTEQFGFGLRSSAYNLEAKTVRSIHLPLMLSYAFGNRSIDLKDNLSDRYLRNKLSFGVAYVLLDGITGTIYERESAGESSIYQEGWLSDQTFNRHNAEVMIGYDRYITKRLALGLQARYRVRNQFSDAFIQQHQSVIAPNAWYLGLQASYHLF